MFWCVSFGYRVARWSDKGVRGSWRGMDRMMDHGGPCREVASAGRGEGRAWRGGVLGKCESEKEDAEDKGWQGCGYHRL
jgi:hypothetical protein